MELSQTAHVLTDFLNEIDESECDEVILIGVQWDDEGHKTPSRLIVKRTASGAASTVIPLAICLGYAAAEMESKGMEIKVPTGKVLVSVNVPFNLESVDDLE